MNCHILIWLILNHVVVSLVDVGMLWEVAHVVMRHHWLILRRGSHRNLRKGKHLRKHLNINLINI